MKLTSLTRLSFAISTPTSVPPLEEIVFNGIVRYAVPLGQFAPGKEWKLPLEDCSSLGRLQHTLKNQKMFMIILHLVMMLRLMVLVIISYLVIAMEVSGVVGAPFQTIVLPHDIARAEFQP